MRVGAGGVEVADGSVGALLELVGAVDFFLPGTYREYNFEAIVGSYSLFNEILQRHFRY